LAPPDRPAPNRAIATAHGFYLVQGLDRFAVGGDLDAEVTTAVDEHHARHGRAPEAVVWDDVVFTFRARTLRFGLARVAVPVDDPLLAGRLDSAARVAVRADALGEGPLQTVAALAAAAPDAIAHAPGLLRLIGWPQAAPLLAPPPLRPTRSAERVSVVINYRDRSSTTVSCLLALRQQERRAHLELLLVDNASRPPERLVVDTVARHLFGADPTASIVHVDYDAPFNHSAQCNRATEAASGEVLLMLSNDCALLDPEMLQAMADWALEPGVGVVGPRLVDGYGLVSGAGMTLSERPAGSGAWHLHEAEVPYLADIVRHSNGASFACAATARTVWRQLGGADETRFPIDYNDADYCLRLTEAGLVALHLGTHAARHSAGLAGLRTQHHTAAQHGQLASRHDLAAVPRRNPAALPLKSFPAFPQPQANALTDYVRLFRRAWDLREAGVSLAPPLAAAWDRLHAVAHEAEGRGMPAPGFHDRIGEAVHGVCVAFAATETSERVPERYRRSLEGLSEAFAVLAANARRPTVPIALPVAESAAVLAAEAAPPPAPATLPVATPPPPAPDPAFVSHADPSSATAEHRLLVFADAFGPSQQILFLEALAQARMAGRAAVTLVTEADLRTLASLRNADGADRWLRDLLAHVRPTAIVWSRFADTAGHKAVEAAAAGWERVPRVAHLDDDFWTLPAVIGVDRFREARHPRRIHALNAIADDADLILASTPVLAGRLAQLFGADRVALCPMHEGGVPAVRREETAPPVIGYFGSASHGRDLEMVAPALRRLKTARPSLRIEIVGSVARRSAAIALGDLVERRAEVEPDYGTFRRGMRDWGWTIGLAPLATHPFNAAKTPIKWTEYAAAGIAVIASRTEPYLDLAREGALLLASADEWEGAIATLLDTSARRRGLLDASDRLLLRFDGWDRMERRLLGLLARAAAQTGTATRAAA